MGESTNPEEEKKEEKKWGLFKKTMKPIDANIITVKSLNKMKEVSEKTGIEFTYDGDKNTFTPYP